MKRVLLTGATGLIGRHCLPTLLAQGYEVHTVSTRAASAHLSGVHTHQADLLDQAQVTALLGSVQPSHLLHLAWYTQPGAYWTSLENIRWVQAGLGLLQLFAAHGGVRVVIAGSCAEYDWSYGYCTERITPLQPATLYGKAKHALQLLEDAFAEQAQISAAWGRLFFVYGPHEYPERLVASVSRALLQGQPARCSHGNQIRDFLYVQDAADALVALLTTDVRGAVNIGSGAPIALKQIIYSIADMLGQRGLVQLGALPSPLNEPSLLVANVERLANEVVWRPTYDLEHGLEQTVHWWKGTLSDE
jgi:nucleoside-diphosphate-sugar epimerase